MKIGKEGTIPCTVTDPKINVTLYERASNMPLGGTYHPGKGFTAALNDSAYICRGVLNGETHESQAFYVYSLVGKPVSWPHTYSMSLLLNVTYSIISQCIIIKKYMKHTDENMFLPLECT